MNLGELLDELRTGILHDVSDQVAGGQSDYLWSDERLVRYINEAQNRLARKALVIREWQNPDVCQFTTVSGQDKYVLDKHIIAVLSIRMSGDNVDLPRAGHSDFDTYKVPSPYFFDPSQLSTLPPGKPRAFSTDEGVADDGEGSYRAMTLRLFPIPDAANAGATANMRVARLPLVPLTLDNLDARPEIPEDHHLNMLDWAAYLALRKTDLDVAGGDARARAADFKNSFQAHVDDCLQEFKRKVFTPAQFAFGRNGFTYERE